MASVEVWLLFTLKPLRLGVLTAERNSTPVFCLFHALVFCQQAREFGRRLALVSV